MAKLKSKDNEKSKIFQAFVFQGDAKVKLKNKDFIEIEYTGKLKEDNTIFDTTDEEIAKKNDLDLKIESHLDAYINPIDCQEYNIIAIGSGRVNKITKMVHKYFEDDEDEDKSYLKVRFKRPDTSTIVSDLSCRRLLYRNRDAGLLTLVSNPWASEARKNRIIVLAASKFNAAIVPTG